MNCLMLNGPNRNLLGLREPELYGNGTYQELLSLITSAARELGVEVHCFQSNHEGVLVDQIQEAHGVYDGIVINPAAYTHTSIALSDALKAVGLPAVEVHISDVTKREAFRQISYIRPVCVKTFMGLGFQGYVEAIKYLKHHLSGAF